MNDRILAISVLASLGALSGRWPTRRRPTNDPTNDPGGAKPLPRPIKADNAPPPPKTVIEQPPQRTAAELKEFRKQRRKLAKR